MQSISCNDFFSEQNSTCVAEGKQKANFAKLCDIITGLVLLIFIIWYDNGVHESIVITLKRKKTEDTKSLRGFSIES